MHSLIFYRFDPGYNGIPVTYVLYPDEGHGFARPENSISFNAITEAAKGGDIQVLPRRTQALHGLLDTACGLTTLAV